MSARLFIAAAALLGMASAASGQEGQPAYPPAKVRVAVAELRNMAPVVEVSGTVVSLNDSRIAAEVEGVLTWLADVGDAVDSGAVIARIDPRLVRIEVTRAEAAVARYEADLKYREQQLARSEGLAATNNVSANLLDESRANRDQALNQLADARAQLQRARGDLSRTEVRAPFAGHVVQRLASVGEYIGMGDDVVRLVDTWRKEIALPAPISLTNFVKPGMEVAVRNGGTERQHEVRTVVPVGDAVSRMVEIRLKANDSDWLVGSPVQVSLPANDPVNAVAVPRDALIQRGGESYLYRVNDDGKAEQVTAKVESTVGLWVAISDGVDPGDQVVIRGAERLAPGQAVEIILAEGAR